MKNNWKEDFLPSCLAGAICGITCLLALLFLAPEKWYYAFIVAVIMVGVSLYFSGSEKRKSAARYKRDEHLIKEEWFFCVEGFIRRDSDRKAKFFFGEDGVTVLSYKNVKPIIDFYGKEKISALYFDRCGWLAIMMPEEKMRLVVPKEEAEKAHKILLEKGWGKNEFSE
ncbi:MAG: hypothetical protein IJ945_02280 [Oscillospiraceae bacterium]|nr:hypothetical protein [Oscillospiraceae bacterium]